MFIQQFVMLAYQYKQGRSLELTARALTSAMTDLCMADLCWVSCLLFVHCLTMLMLLQSTLYTEAICERHRSKR